MADKIKIEDVLGSYKSSLNELKQLTSDLSSLNASITKETQDQVDLVNNINSINEEINKLKEKGNKLTQDEQKRLTDIQSTQSTYQDKLAKSNELIKKQSSEQMSLQAKRAQLEIKTAKQQELYTQNVQSVLNTKKNILDTEQESSSVSMKISKLDQVKEKGLLNSMSLMTTINGLIDKGVDERNVEYKVLTDLQGINNDIINQTVMQTKQLEASGLQGATLVDVQDSKNKLIQYENLIKEKGSEIDSGTVQVIQSQLKEMNAVIGVQEKNNATIEKGKEIATGVNDTLQTGFTKMNGLISQVPGGDKIISKLGLDKIQSEIQEKVGNSMSEAFVKAGGGIKGFASAGVSGIKSMAAALMTPPAGIIILLALAVAGIMAMVGAFNDVDEAVGKVGEGMEVGTKEAVKMRGAAIDMANDMGMVGINADEVGEAMVGLREAFGGLRIDPTVNPAMKGLVEQTTLLTTKFGLSADEAKDLYSTSIILGTSMEKLTTTAAVFGDKTIGSKQALKDLAKLPKEVTVGFKGTVEQLVKANVKAKMMGTTLEKMKDIGEGMLDIESSLDAEMEARILTGKNINLDRARELALAGDVAGLQDEVLNQMGSLEEFKKMDVMAQKAQAKALGMSVEEMTTMLTKAEENKALGIDSAKMKELEAASAEELNKLTEDAAKSGNEAYANKLKSMAAEKESAGIAEKLQDIWTKIKNTLTKVMLPIVEMVHGLFDATDATKGIGSALGPVGAAFSMVGKVVSTIFGVVGSIVSILFTLVKSALSPIFEVFGEIFGVVSGLFEEVKGIFATISGPGGDATSGLKSTFEVIGKVIGAVGGAILRFLVEPLKLVVNITSGIIKLFTGDAVGGLKQIGTAIMDFILAPFNILAKFIDTVFGTNIKGIFSSITSAFQPLINLVAEFAGKYLMGVWNIIKGLGDVIKTNLLAPFNLVMDIGKAIFQMLTGDFMGGITAIGDSISKFVMAPFNAVKSLIDTIVGTVSGMFDTLKKGASLVSGLFGGDDEEDKKKQESKPVGASSSPGTDLAMVTEKTSQGTPVEGKAEGGEVQSPTGFAVVGEKGPELVKLPNGSSVMPADQTSGMLSSGQAAAPTGGTPQQGGGSSEMAEILSTLKSILAVASQPAMVKLGDTFVHELDSKLSLRAGMRVNMDQTWGKT